MTKRLITGPAQLAVSIEDARDAARANGTDRDAEIEIAVRTLTEEVEHLTGRAIVNQTWRVTLDRFPDAIRLPAPPVASVLSLEYLDVNGIRRTLDPRDYVLDNASEPGFIVPAPGRAWPETWDQINTVTALVECGYGPDHTTTPAAIKGYIIARVREMFRPPGERDSPHLVRLLDRYVVYG